MPAKILIPIATAAALAAGSIDQAALGADTASASLFTAEHRGAKERRPQSLLLPALESAASAAS